VHKARFGVHADVRLHAEVPLLALLALVHLKVTLAAPVPGGARRSDQGGVDHSASAQQLALAFQQVDSSRWRGMRNSTLMGSGAGSAPWIKDDKTGEVEMRHIARRNRAAEFERNGRDHEAQSVDTVIAVQNMTIS
jgi:hypothetical protein